MRSSKKSDWTPAFGGEAMTIKVAEIVEAEFHKKGKATKQEPAGKLGDDTLVKLFFK